MELVVVANEAITFRLDHARLGARVLDLSVGVVDEVVGPDVAPPPISFDVVEDHLSAGVRRVAANDARWEDGVMDRDVLQSDVAHRDQGLSGTGHQWVEEAARVVRGAGLVLLLGTDVDGPPDWLVDLEVFVVDASDLTA